MCSGCGCRRGERWPWYTTCASEIGDLLITKRKGRFLASAVEIGCVWLCEEIPVVASLGYSRRAAEIGPVLLSRHTNRTQDPRLRLCQI